LMHIDTTFKFQEMIEFRDWYCDKIGADLIVHTNEDALAQHGTYEDWSCTMCASLLKTQALIQALQKYKFDAAFGGARRDEEASRAKERVLSFRDSFMQWDPKNQRPELWDLYNTRHAQGESFRVFPLSNWTELDIWSYIHSEQIPIVPLYYAKERPVVRRDGMLMMVGQLEQPRDNEEVEMVKCRFRTLGCQKCTGAVESDADTLEKIIEEIMLARHSERMARAVDRESGEGSMEDKKREGYF
ncbi:MAG: sulfate adenylyltransferase subunit CysD, partial [Planctomycetota bacterium]